MVAIDTTRKSSKKQQAKLKKVSREKMIREANARHDAEFGANPDITTYYTHYIQGTGLRRSK